MLMMNRFSWCAVLLGVLAGCTSKGYEVGRSEGTGATSAQGDEPGGSAPTEFDPLPAEQQDEIEQLSQELEESRELDAEGLLAKRALTHLESLSYRPRDAEFLDRIQASTLGLTDAELAKLDDNGFVISKRQAFPTFVRGYAAVYFEHLPVFISADAILEAVHSSYDELLRLVELEALIPMVTELLASVHAALGSSTAEESVRADLDTYLSVARSLLEDGPVSPVAGGNPTDVQRLVAVAKAADGLEDVTLFGAPRTIDGSQYVPRGHYTETRALTNYFRAMMWLGREDLRLLETQPDGTLKFLRPQYEAMLLLRELLDDQATEQWTKVDAALQAFVGESDYMVVPEVDSLVADLGGPAAARAATDEAARAAILAGGYGFQEIASHVMVNGGVVETLPLSRSFALFGQRYVLDSYVFSQVVYDRVPVRLMPDPLDAAFAALGNDAALPLLDLTEDPKYPGALDATRTLTDAHSEGFWDANLYNLWSSALRALSPKSTSDEAANAGLPEVSLTEPWNRRVLNTQLGSWAELRHDSLLYVKQSYTGVPVCEYPDAYVDPYPEFFERLERFAERGVELAGTFVEIPGTTETMASYFGNLKDSMSKLRGMAQNQREGTPFTAEQMEFVNRAVRIEPEAAGCVTIDVPDGWLADLYLRPETSIELDPVIADVHTQPADGDGNIVGRVLHVATGYPRLLVMTADTCVGPRAYVGLAFAYHEKITEDFDRFTDERWKSELASTTPPDVPWMESLLAE